VWRFPFIVLEKHGTHLGLVLLQLAKQLVQGQTIDIVLHVGCQIRVVHLYNAADEELANELKKLLPRFLQSDGQKEKGHWIWLKGYRGAYRHD
jgi:hypothetical protein